MSARRFLVSGRVQGVGFRWFVYRNAQRLRLKGWTRNLPDGRIEIVAAGPDAQLTALEQLLRAGPDRARVDAVNVTDHVDDVSEQAGFEIR